MKRICKHRIARIAALLTSGMLFGGIGFTNTEVPGGGCQSFATNGVLSSVDFCYLLNCDNGFFGGVVQPCGDPNSALDDLLVDCGAAPVADEEVVPLTP